MCGKVNFDNVTGGVKNQTVVLCLYSVGIEKNLIIFEQVNGIR